MGELRDKVIVQSRVYLDPTTNPTPIPPYDYNYTYPITVYEAVKRGFDTNATTLDDELNSIYNLIAGKQPIISGGKVGSLLTFTTTDGIIGETDIVKSIESDPILRSHFKVPSERAVGQALESKVNLLDFQNHINNSNHITDEERNKWNKSAEGGLLEDHKNNKIVHITQEEREQWNKGINSNAFNAHILDINNPHRVTAHQVGTYNRAEIDDMIKSIRDSFFNYRNIKYDDRTNTASLTDYESLNWNPNYVLSYGDPLPTVVDDSITYFALKPATDYATNETQVVYIYIKKPKLEWTNIGTAEMSPGDLVVRYKDTVMYVWMQGRFVNIFHSQGGGGGSSSLMWRPILSSEGILTWTRSEETIAPDPVTIKGPPGNTPVKGVDYFDGVDGRGVPTGGHSSDILVKLSDTDFDSQWKPISQAFADYIRDGGGIPKGLVNWDDIGNRPKIYNDLGYNTDGVPVQKAVTDELDKTKSELTDKMNELIANSNSSNTAHINNINNPHRVYPEQIGAVTIDDFNNHIENYNNPHKVTKEQVGLSNVDNTSDLSKPISDATREALNEIKGRLDTIASDSASGNFVNNVTWDNSTCNMTFTFRDKSEVVIEVPIIKVFKSLYYDNNNSELVLILPDNTQHRIDIRRMITNYVGSDSSNISLKIAPDGTISSKLIPDSVTGLELMPSIVLRESPTTTTQPEGDRSTKIATTEFTKAIVIDNLISYETDRPLSANMGRVLNKKKADVEDVLKIISEMEGLDIIDNLESTNPMASLSANMGRVLNITKAPMVHTASAGAVYGRASIDLFGHVRMSALEPLMDGVAFVGTDDGYAARGDHRHPTDLSRAPMHWDGDQDQQMTGTPRAVSPPDNSADNRIATTEWVRRSGVGVMKGTCTSKGVDPYKVVTLKSTYMEPVSFIRQIGSTVSVYFTDEDKSGGRANPTQLNVNDTGFARVLFGDKPLTNGMIGRGHEHMFVFDGVNWRLINPVPGSGQTDITIGPGKPDQGGPIQDDRKIIINQESGYNGVIVDISDPPFNHGVSQYAWITLHIPQRNSDEFDVKLTAPIDEYGIKVGDGRIIKASEFSIVSKTPSNAILQFKIDTEYPTNSPCQLVYRTNKALLQIEAL